MVLLGRAVLAGALLWAALAASIPGRAGEAPAWAGLRNPMIDIEYEVPESSEYQATYEYLKRRQVLEELSAFLSPVRLPYRIKFKLMQCGVANAFYEHGKGLWLCYELPDYLSRLAPVDAAGRGVTRDDVLIGAFIQLALHEVGHAVFDVLQVPILGRQEDAADQISAFVMLQFGPNLARRTLTGAAYVWEQMNGTEWAGAKLADVHGTTLQRFYNVLCIAYGGQPDTFKDLVEAGDLPAERARRCAREYEQVRNAFAKTVWPHLEQELVKKVQAIDWLKWQDPR